jgi:hypothetical protein
LAAAGVGDKLTFTGPETYAESGTLLVLGLAVANAATMNRSDPIFAVTVKVHV